MATQDNGYETVIKNIEEAKPEPLAHAISLREKHAFGIRIWHWLSYLCITSLFMSVIAATYIFNAKDNIPFVQQNIHASGGNINPDQAKSLAHAYNDKVWNWHKNIGIILSCLFLFRLIAEIFVGRDEKFFHRLKRGIKIWKLGGPHMKNARHYAIVKIIYTGFYSLLTVVIITGLIMVFADDVPFFKSIEHGIRSVHNFCMYLTISFVVVHVGGVLIAEGRKHTGVVSDMFNGGE